MKKTLCIVLALALTLSLLMSAALAQEVVSDTFDLLKETTVKAETPVEEPTEEVPAEEEPTEEESTEEPTEEVPAEEPTEEVPTEEPTEEVPAEEPTEEVPAEEVPAEELPTEEVPTEELPTEEVPAEELPTEETPTEELPTEETPAEELPQPERSLAISSNIPADQVKIGDTLTLTALLYGFEGAEVSIAWEQLVDGVWQPTGVTGRLLQVVIDESNAQGMWRFNAIVVSEAPAATQPAVEEAAQ